MDSESLRFKKQMSVSQIVVYLKSSAYIYYFLIEVFILPLSSWVKAVYSNN